MYGQGTNSNPSQESPQETQISKNRSLCDDPNSGFDTQSQSPKALAFSPLVKKDRRRGHRGQRHEIDALTVHVRGSESKAAGRGRQSSYTISILRLNKVLLDSGWSSEVHGRVTRHVWNHDHGSPLLLLGHK